MGLSEGLESIGDNWFRKIAIKEIVIPKSVKTIGDGAFYNCNNLASIILQEGLESIGDDCFRHTAIREIVIPKTVKSIGYNAFSGCKNLTNITL